MLKKCEKQIIVIEMNLFFLYIMMISMFKSEIFTIRSPHMDLKQYTHELIYEGKYIPLTDRLEQFRIVCPE